MFPSSKTSYVEENTQKDKEIEVPGPKQHPQAWAHEGGAYQMEVGSWRP